jgi:Family of unknown function (DUF6572)
VSIEDTNQIDLIAVRPGSPVVSLVINDHLDWDDVGAHCLLLEEKLNAYIAFVESGQLARQHEPELPADYTVEVHLAAQHPPPRAARPFLARAGQILAAVGMALVTDLSTAS